MLILDALCEILQLVTFVGSIVKRICLGIAVLIATGCNSFAALDDVMDHQQTNGNQDLGADTGRNDLGLVDFGAPDQEFDADASDMGPTGIDSTLFYAPSEGCMPSLLEGEVLEVGSPEVLNGGPATGVSIVVDAKGDGLVRWISGTSVLGASVSIVPSARYEYGVGPWTDFLSRDVLDTHLVRLFSDPNQSLENPDIIFSGTAVACSGGESLYGESALALDLSAASNPHEQNTCPLAQEFGVGAVGGYNSFHPENTFSFFYMVSFSTEILRSWDLGTKITEHKFVELPAAMLAPDIEYPFIESTTGSLIGFGSADGNRFSFWDAKSGGEIFDAKISGARGKIALLHLVNEHYVLANINNSSIVLHSFEYQTSGVTPVIVWANETKTIGVGQAPQFIELAAMPGGFTLFYDQMDRWTLQPILLYSDESGVEMFHATEQKIVNNYSTPVTYSDMDFTAITYGCDLVFGLAAGVTGANETNYINVEGGVIPQFYGQPVPD